jgi:tetratricopeptide (TPR) repeat protein
MRRLFEQVRKRLSDFVEQRDDVLLVVRCNDGDAALVLKVLQEVDEADPSDLFWVFGDEFRRADEYVGKVFERFEERHRLVGERLKELGRPPWPLVPSDLRQPGASAADRMRRLMVFARSLLPDGPDFRIIWAPFPLKLAEPAGHAALFAELLRSDGPLRWYHHVRIVTREDPRKPALSEALANTPRVTRYEPDLSGSSQEKSLEEDVTDSSLPVAQRMQSLLLLAGMDYAHRRFGNSLKKYGILLEYYRGMGNHPMTALVLNGMGEVHQRAGDLKKAKAHFECALTPAILAESPPILLNVTLNLANLMLVARSWRDGEDYYDSAEKLATAQLNAPTKIQCLENRGVCQDMQNNARAAAESWEAGATLAKATEEKELQRRILERLRALYDRHGEGQRKATVEKELATLRAGAQA